MKLGYQMKLVGLTFAVITVFLLMTL